MGSKKNADVDRVKAAKDRIKLGELKKVGARQGSTSNGRYINFPLAVRLIEARLGVRFTKPELAQAEHEWLGKFGTLVAGLEEHDVDERDGYCFTCSAFHSGDNFDVVRIVQTKRFSREVSKAVVCKNTHLETDGFCTVCGENHRGGERKPKPDSKVVASLLSSARATPYADLTGVSHRDLRLDMRLWKMTMMSSQDLYD